MNLHNIIKSLDLSTQGDKAKLYSSVKLISNYLNCDLSKLPLH